MKKNRRKKTQIKLLISFFVPSSCTQLFIFAFAFMLRYKKKCRTDYSIYLIKIQDNLKLKYLLQGQAILHQILKLLLVHSCVCVCVQLAEKEWRQLPNGEYTTAEARPNAYIPLNAQLPLPKPYGAQAPFKPSQPGTNMRHFRKPELKSIEI